MQLPEANISSDLIGHNPMLEHMMRSVQAGRIVHALLLQGDRGTGKKQAARLLGQAMLCTGSEKPCGRCSACLQFQAGTHPDVHIINLENRPAKRRSLGVEDAREIVDTLAMKPFLGNRHVVIVEEADRFTPQAQNALLKTLESPPGDASILLIAETTSSLLPTILSRCVRVRMNALPLNACQEALIRRGIPADRAKLLSALSRGSLGEAMEIDADGDYLPLREKVFQSLEALSDRASVAKASSLLINDKGAAQKIASILELIALDLMYIDEGLSPAQEDAEDRMRRMKVKGARLLKAVIELRIRLNSNVQWTSALEYMYFDVISDGGHA